MINGELLNIEPSEIIFPFELRKEISCVVHVSNITDSNVAFKVFSNSPKKYWVQPKTGFILPRSTCDIVVYMKEQNEVPPDMLCTDKFLIQSMVGSHFPKPGEVAPEMLIRESRRVYENKLNVVYIPPHQQCSSINVRSKSFTSRESLAKEEDWSGYEVTRAVSDIKDRFSESCIGKLLKIVPSQLKFSFELNREMSCILQLTNITKHHVAFKMKTTNPRQYSVRPNMGIILPQATCDITVRMQAQKETPPNMLCKDKFVLQSIFASPSTTTVIGINPEMFKKSEGHDIEDYIFPVVFLIPPLSVHPVKEELGGNLEASSIKNENSSGSESASFVDEQMSVGDLLTVKPLELNFPLQLNKRVSCFLHLTNKTGNHVAFKVRATNPAKYTVQPSAGFILPQSKFDVVVTLLPQKKIPPDIQIQEKFLIQCLVAIPGSTSKDAIRELFTKEAANVRECKLRVVFVPLSEPQLPFREGSIAESSSETACPYQSNQSQSSVAEQDKQLVQPKVSVSEDCEESSSIAASGEKIERSISSLAESEEKKEEASIVSEANATRDDNGKPASGWAIFCVVIVLVGVFSSILNGNVVIKMLPVMMKTLMEMVSEMIGDWVVKALVVVCFQLLFGYHLNNNNN